MVYLVKKKVVLIIIKKSMYKIAILKPPGQKKNSFIKNL